MAPNLIERSTAAYSYPLLIKHLLHTALIHAPEQEIIYRSQRRHTYRAFNDRIGRLASGLAKLGVQSGQTVAVMDWDSHRYLECFFAVPMMGAMLQTVNMRLSPEQITYTINHAGARDVLVHADFLPVLRGDQGQARRGADVHLHRRRWRAAAMRRSRLPREYEELLAEARRRGTPFPISTRTRAPRRSTRPARRGCPRASISAIGSWCCTPSLNWRRSAQRGRQGAFPSRRRVHADHADVPRPRLGLPLCRHRAGREAGLSRALRSRRACRI